MPKQTKLNPADLTSDRDRKRAKPGGRFDCLLDGNVWRFDFNVDFRGKPGSLLLLARRHANEHGMVAEHQDSAPNLLIWYRKATPADLYGGSKCLRKWFEDNDYDLTNPMDEVTDDELDSHSLSEE